MEKNRALTADEVAVKLQIAKNTVYELIKRGELQSYKVGRKVRIDLSDFNDYVKRSKGESHIASDTQASYRFTPSINDLTISPAFIISGQDPILDIIANMLQNHPDGVQTLRSYVGSFKGLMSLYYDQCQIAAIHLWDGDTNDYNIPYVKHMVPGIPCVIINLAKRVQGFYVQKNNPKNIKSWVCLTRDDVSLINREKGSGTRVLLDEKIKQLLIKPQDIKGYYNEKTSHFAIANTVAKGLADVGLGCQSAAMGVNNIDFIPLHTERYDLVIKSENLNDPTYKLIYDIISSDAFKENVEHLIGYDFENLGQIIAET